MNSGYGGSRPMSVDDFLGHSNRSSGGRAKKLGDWKKSDQHDALVWLHTQAPIYALWRHGWKKIELRKDKDTQQQVREVWQDKIVCYESEVVLQNQDWRDRETGVRERPPVLCPHCKMIEWHRALVFSGEVSFTAPAFLFQGDDASKREFLHVGGLYNGFGAKNLTDAQKAEMKAVAPAQGGPIWAKDAWKENQKAKLEYVFTVVNERKPEDGILITVEPNGLGQKVQEVIGKSIKELGREEGNPALNPYAIQWQYDPREGVAFDKQYDATRMGRVKMRPIVEQLIRRTAPPSITYLTDRFNLDKHRANLERHAIPLQSTKGRRIDVPWDSFFEAARREVGSRPQVSVPRDVTPPFDHRSVGAGAGDERDEEKPAEPAGATDDGLFGCDTDGCAGVMRATDIECSVCHRRYDVLAALGHETPKPLPKRSAASPAPAPAADPGKQFGVQASAIESDPNDDIPF